ncbi:MAG TPA: ribokinase [Vicinamibacterales bacterium]|nr:ribokinase [Vicinamibacterales bacterium]
MKRSSTIVVVGSLNADLVSRVSRLPTPGETVTVDAFETHAGGKGANQAFAAARLGGAVAMIGCVGDDAHGRRLKAGLQEEGVDVSGIEVDGKSPSGMALVTVDAHGENHIVVVPGANASLTSERLARHRERLASASVVLLQLEVPLPAVCAAARMAREGGAIVILDPAPAQPIPGELLEDTTYITPNEIELISLTEQLGAGPREGDPGTRPDPSDVALRARMLLRRGASNVIVKLGDAGARLFSREGEHTWPARPTTVADTTGAGDAFNAALAVSLASGATIVTAGILACTAASLSVSRHGAQSSMPTLAEVLEALPSPELRPTVSE